MRIYVKNTRTKFHTDALWNDGALSPVHTDDYTVTEIG